tara:strand:+ start:2196 stop:3092 length:897 start_codon:yes stop_codon:yes gene_type:complete
VQITESRLKAIVYEEVANRIIDEIIEEEVLKFISENKELEAIRRSNISNLKKLVKKGLLGMAIVAPILGALQSKTADRAAVAAANREAAELRVDVEQSLSSHALEDTVRLLKATSQYMWSLSPDVDKQTVGGQEGEDFQKTVSSRQNFPLFQDYMGGRTQMLSGERGVVQKVYDDIKQQMAQGVTLKSDLKPGITDVRDASVSASDYIDSYKQRYNLPDFNPAKVSQQDIGGNQQQVQDAAQKINPEGFEFLKVGNESFGYESYELLDTINPELPNSKLSPSQYYMQVFNKVTGQNAR